jgi:hypothetical protein
LPSTSRNKSASSDAVVTAGSVRVRGTTKDCPSRATRPRPSPPPDQRRPPSCWGTPCASRVEDRVLGLRVNFIPERLPVPRFRLARHRLAEHRRSIPALQMRIDRLINRFLIQRHAGAAVCQEQSLVGHHQLHCASGRSRRPAASAITPRTAFSFLNAKATSTSPPPRARAGNGARAKNAVFASVIKRPARTAGVVPLDASFPEVTVCVKPGTRGSPPPATPVRRAAPSPPRPPSCRPHPHPRHGRSAGPSCREARRGKSKVRHHQRDRSQDGYDNSPVCRRAIRRSLPGPLPLDESPCRSPHFQNFAPAHCAQVSFIINEATIKKQHKLVTVIGSKFICNPPIDNPLGECYTSFSTRMV